MIAGLVHEDEIWPTPASDKLQDIWKEVKKKYPSFFKLKPFIKKYLTATDKGIRNSRDLIDNFGILKDR